MSQGSSSTHENTAATAAPALAATADSNNAMPVGLEALRRANVAGKIPIQLTLAKTSLSSSKAPPPQHALVSRQTFLHLGLESAVRSLHEYALPTLSFLGTNPRTVVKVVQQDDDSDEAVQDTATSESKATQASTTGAAPTDQSNGDNSHSETDKDGNDDDEEESLASKEAPPYPICWFEDVATGQPLRWQYFVGVLLDSLQAGQARLLPWRIRLHFRSYPSPQLLELGDANWGQNGGVLETLKMVFRNSLKQGFTIRYGNSKEALNLSKQSHDQIWEGISRGDYDQLAPIVYRDDEVETAAPPPTTTSSSSTNTAAATAPGVTKGDEADPSTQASKTDAAENDATHDSTKSPESASEATQSPTEQETLDGNPSQQQQQPPPHLETINNLAMLPVRLSVDPTKPMIQKRFEGGTTASAATLGSLLLEWAPAHFERMVDPDTFSDANADANPANTESSSSTSNTNSSKLGQVRPRSEGVRWRVAGLAPPLSTPLLDLWLALRHPDNFLYVSLAVE